MAQDSKADENDKLTSISSFFLLSVKGEVVSGHFPGVDNIYCKYSFAYGDDWTIVSGQEESCSQISKVSSNADSLNVWNLPIDVTFKSCNPFNWPSLIVSIYGFDFFGNDIIRGYATSHVPSVPGPHTKSIAAFVPQSSSLFNAFTSWFTGKRPEFIHSKLIAQGEGRGMVRVNTQGFVNIKFNIMIKDLAKYGFQYT